MDYRTVKTITNLLFAATLLCIPLAAWSQDAQPPAQLLIRAPVETPVQLESVRVQTDIRGGLALTAVEMVFFNPNRRQLEGELQFPLLAGQRVVGFAMDVDGRLRDAVAIEKARGQAVFEEITRARVDPGLLQVTRGNNYKLRVYPILPRSRKAVVIRYLEPLAPKAREFRFRLPLNYAETLPSFELTVTVTGGLPRALGGQEVLGAFTFERSGSFYTARVLRQQFAGRGVLELAIPAADAPGSFIQNHAGRTYFYAEVPVAATHAVRRLPGAVGLLWDSSGSGASRDHAREFALLDAYFAKASDIEVRLVRLRDVPEPAETHYVRNGDWRELKRALEATIYDGGTNLSANVFSAAAAGVEEWLLFSDGLANYGGPRFDPPALPVYTISSSLRTDPAWLRHLAHRTGARHIDLVAEKPEGAARKLLNQSWRLLSVTARGAEQLVTASPYPENDRIQLAGVLREESAHLDLQIGLDTSGARRLRVELGPRSTESPFAAFMWASLRVAELEGETRINRAEIRRIAKAHGLATRETSLIVLDRIEDYMRHEIVPPAELRAEYERLLQRARLGRRDTARAQLERVVRLFEDRQTWWNRAFPKDTPQTALIAPRPAPQARPALVPMPMMSAPSRARAAPEAAARSAAQPLQDPGSAAPAEPAVAAIRLHPWRPDAPYLERFAGAAPAELYSVYLTERANYANSTAFFLDAAQQFFERALPDLALRVLSNLAEMDLENRDVLRVLGYRLLQAGKPRLAIPVFEQILELAPEEPQSYRDLGLAYAADLQYQKAVDHLYAIVDRPWHGRFPEIELIALTEMNAIIRQAQRAAVALDLARIDPRLIRNLPLDLRVVLSWDADNTDIDLWVTDPNGDKAYYGRRLTYQGGRMSPDFTGGYGPEEFSLRHAKPGRYTVRVNFYGHTRQVIAGATTLQLRFITGFGTPQQHERIVTLRLRERGEQILVGEFEIEPAAP